MSKKGVWADPKKVAVICEWPVLKNITEVHSFLGFVNYYRRFLKGYVKIARLLYDLILGPNANRKRKLDH